MTKEERDRLIIEELGGHACLLPVGFLSTPDGFFWWWPRAQRKEWWPDFIDHICVPGTNFLNIEIIDPDRGADVLAEFLTQRKEV